MHKKISKAPTPIGSLPIGHAAPQQKPKSSKVAEPKQPTESYYRFKQAIHRGDRRAAEFYAQKCRDQGLSESHLTELALLDDCRPNDSPNQRLIPDSKGKAHKIITGRMIEAVEKGEIPLEEFLYMQGKYLMERFGENKEATKQRKGHRINYDRGTVSKAHKEAVAILSNR
jgi:hypothetical protein